MGMVGSVAVGLGSGVGVVVGFGLGVPMGAPGGVPAGEEIGCGETGVGETLLAGGGAAGVDGASGPVCMDAGGELGGAAVSALGVAVGSPESGSVDWSPVVELEQAKKAKPARSAARFAACWPRRR